MVRKRSKSAKKRPSRRRYSKNQSKKRSKKSRRSSNESRRTRRRSPRKLKFGSEDDNEDDSNPDVIDPTKGKVYVKIESYSTTPRTLEELDEYYFFYFNQLYNKLKYLNPTNSSKINPMFFTPPLITTKLEPGINEEAYDNLKDSSKFLEYKDQNQNITIQYVSNESKGILGIGGRRRCISKGTWSGEPIVNFYECLRPDIGPKFATYRFGTNITISKPSGFNHKMDISLITSKVGKKMICFSLLSPSNKHKFIKTVVGIVNTKAKVTEQEPEILNFELSNVSSSNIFISFPLSSNTKHGVPLFNYDKFKETIPMNDISSQFYNLINVNSPQSTFESIVKVTTLFYNNFKDEYVLVYHCKSGKDRTSLFDSVVQATLSYLKQKELSQQNETRYELTFGRVPLTIDAGGYVEIRKMACKFMMFGFLIGYYGTGYFGLKLGSNKSLSEYILGDLYNFYFGHAKLAKSSS
jgi:hypothetical protein